MKSIWLFLFLFCSTIQAAKENVKREIKEEEVSRSVPIYEKEVVKVEESGSLIYGKEVEGSGSIPVPGFKLRNLTDDQKRSIYAALYLKRSAAEEDLYVSRQKNQSLNVACQFFNEWKKSGKLTGNPKTDVRQVKRDCLTITGRINQSYRNRVPNVKLIVKAIREAEARREEGERLLKPFLELQPAKRKEGEVEGSGSIPVQGFNLSKDQKRSICAALYLKRSAVEEDLYVSRQKNQSLNVTCQFFNEWKKSGKLTGNPDDDVRQINSDYDTIKGRLNQCYRNSVPNVKLIVKAIKEVKDRQEEGERLLKPLLELQPAKRKEGEVEGSVQKLNLIKLSPDQKVAIYAALYLKRSAEEKNLHVSQQKNYSLHAMCQFFNEWKKLRTLTGNPDDDVRQINSDYDTIKGRLKETYRSYVPKLDRLVDAIQEAQDRQEEGERLLKPLLEVQEGAVEGSEKEVVKVEEPEALFYEEESSSVKIKQEPLDQPGYILKKEAELDQIQ